MPVAKGNTRRHLSFSVDELYAIYAQLLNEGFTVKQLSLFINRCSRQYCNMRDGVSNTDRPLVRPSDETCSKIDALLKR